MRIDADEILLHYEEYGGIDIKMRITSHIVAMYLMDCDGVSESYARKAAFEMRDPMNGWAVVMDQDERFYVWCKHRKKNIDMALNAIGAKVTYAICYETKAKQMKIAVYHRLDRANAAMNGLSDKGLTAAMFKKVYGGTYRVNPIRRKKCDEAFLEMAYAVLVRKDLSALKEGAKADCRKRRAVNSCRECSRCGIPGCKGCPFYDGEEEP